MNKMQTLCQTPSRPSRHIRSGSDQTPTKSYEKSTAGKFQATNMWNKIVKRFRDQMPLKRHRRQLTYYDESFTGKEAVDFMMVHVPQIVLQGRGMSRENCVTLLQKLMDQEIFRKVRFVEEKEIFKDNATLYVFHGEGARTPLLISEGTRLKRSNSVHGESSSLLPRNCEKLKGEDWNGVIPREAPELAGFNRRISMSHGNLSHVALPPFNPSEDLNRTRDALKEFAINQRVREGTPTTCRTSFQLSKEVEDKENAENSPRVLEDIDKEGAYDWLSFGRRKKKDHKEKKTDQETNVSPTYGTFEKNGDGGGRFRRIRSLKRAGAGRTPLSKLQLVSGHNTVPVSAMGGISCDTQTDFDPPNIRKPPPCLPIPPPPPPILVSDKDTIEIWKQKLFDRLRATLGHDDLDFIKWPVSGHDIRWNCEKVASTGIVKKYTDKADLDGYVQRLMRYLEQFPFHTGSSNVVTYNEKNEVNVFKTVCAHLAREPAFLEQTEAKAIKHCMHLFDHRNNSRIHRKVVGTMREFFSWFGNVFNGTGKEQANLVSALMRLQNSADNEYSTEFNAHTPCVRMMSRRATTESVISNGTSPFSTTSSYDTSPLPQAIRVQGISEGVQIAFNSSADDCYSDVHGISPSLPNRRPERLIDSGALQASDVLSLPGVKNSPELLLRMRHLGISPQSYGVNSVASSSSYYSAASRVSPVIRRLDPQLIENLLAAVGLILLTMPPWRRRRLHTLIRFMGKISANHCLQFGAPYENRYVMLESLCHCVVPADAGLSVGDSIHITTLLVDCERKIFTVDEQLKRDVYQTIGNMMTTDQPLLNSIPTPPTNVVQFCQKIETEEYEKQRRTQNDLLLSLLDQANLMPEPQREKRLKQFKKTYPEVYSIRFPNEERKEKEPGILKRIFSRRNE